MPNVIKRLGLGIFLILAASAILLFADRNHRSTAQSSESSKVHRIAVLQHANTPVLDDSFAAPSMRSPSGAIAPATR